MSFFFFRMLITNDLNIEKLLRCSYTVNVATLAYERRIRGVYQATRLTIISAWLHTCCWLLSALLALVRILLAVDFQLVRISADLLGDLDKILVKYFHMFLFLQSLISLYFEFLVKYTCRLLVTSIGAI